MDTSSRAYKKAFEAYIRRGTPFQETLNQHNLTTKQQRTTTHYIWRTRDDGKVRASHAANNGKIFAWNNPPKTGHPGEDYGCRCIAEPYTPEDITQPIVSNEFSLSEKVPPSDGLFGTNWEFKGGKRIKVKARSTNVLGIVGVRIYYDVFGLSGNGKVIPQFRSRDSSGKQVGLNILPLGTSESTITADFESPFGYYWILRAESAQATDNESYIFYTVYR